MVKPVFKALNEMKAAETGDVALEIGVAFLRSADALYVDDGRAGTFVKSLGDIFAKHQTPDLHEVLLGIAVAEDSKVSFGLRASSAFALTDLRAAARARQEVLDALPQSIANAKILSGVKATQTSGKDGVFLESGNATDSLAYDEISAARSPDFLKDAINDILLMGEEITNHKAPEFMRVLNVAFRKTGTTAEQRIEMLSMIADATSEKDKLHDLAVDEANRQIRDTEGPAPRTAHTGGGALDLSMK